MKTRMSWHLIGESLATTPEALLATVCSALFESNIRHLSTEQILLCYISASRFYPAHPEHDEAVLRAVVHEALHHGVDLDAQTLLNDRSDSLGGHLASLSAIESSMSEAADQLLQMLLEAPSSWQARQAISRLALTPQI